MMWFMLIVYIVNPDSVIQLLPMLSCTYQFAIKCNKEFTLKTYGKNTLKKK